ncbi:MAG: hypothetical protein ABSA50_12400 [Candidatus Bathyarchaeia archaeon]
MESTPELVRKFAPEISFSKNEPYFPCPIFFSGADIVSNREKYEPLTPDQKRNLISCYYHVSRYESHTAYEYWYYYVYNDYSGGWDLGAPDIHDHDMEFAIVYVDNASGTVYALALNQHHWRNWVWMSNDLKVFAEEGGHGLFRKRTLLDSWKPGGLTIKVDPKESVESLRNKFIDPEPANLMENDGTIKGQTAIFLGAWAKPKVPWVRQEYVFPISQLLADADKDKARMLSAAPRAMMYPREITLSIPYNKPTRKENLDEALRLQLISDHQYKAML